MAQFMVLTMESGADEGQLAPLDTRALIEGHSAYARKLRAASAYRDGERLRPSVEGRRVRNRDGLVRVEAGPFAEASVTGYYVLEAETLGAAVELAKGCPMSPGAELDVRPLQRGQVDPDKTSRPGRVFAFAVLGAAESEEGWTEVMGQIAACSRNDFAAARLLGGVRLEAPGRGRRVRVAGASRVVFDGPFLEGKEVIGGFFFMRMASVHEAVAWTSHAEFVKYGAVEIRELWRS